MKTTVNIWCIACAVFTGFLFIKMIISGFLLFYVIAFISSSLVTLIAIILSFIVSDLDL